MRSVDGIIQFSAAEIGRTRRCARADRPDGDERPAPAPAVGRGGDPKRVAPAPLPARRSALSRDPASTRAPPRASRILYVGSMPVPMVHFHRTCQNAVISPACVPGGFGLADVPTWPHY